MRPHRHRSPRVIGGFFLWLMLGCGITEPTPPAGPPADRVMLIYHGAGQANYRPQYQPDSLIRYLVGFQNGQPIGRIADAVVLLDIYAPSTRALATWACDALGAACATSQDWLEWLNSTVAFLTKLDVAAAQADQWFGSQPINVVLTLQYPPPELSRTQRIQLVRAYMDSLDAKVASANLTHLRLHGYYWLHEVITDSARDYEVLPAISDAAHARGRELWWIPYWNGYTSAWREYGIDRTWIQPNYYFTDAPDVRVQDAERLARAEGLGIEIEFEGAGPFTRLDPYLQVTHRSLAIYEGGGALLRLEQQDPARYAQLVHLLTEVP
jgi:hypothetical protein